MPESHGWSRGRSERSGTVPVAMVPSPEGESRNRGGSYRSTCKQMDITLTWSEVALAASVGMRRHMEALRVNRADSHGRGVDNGWTDHIEGACGEAAAAKALDIYWNGSVNTFKTGGDVGPYQVRTRSDHTFDLIVREDDADDRVFILVRGRVPNFDVVGWIRASDAKCAKWVQTYGGRPPAYFVPASALHALAELRVRRA